MCRRRLGLVQRMRPLLACLDFGAMAAWCMVWPHLPLMMGGLGGISSPDAQLVRRRGVRHATVGGSSMVGCRCSSNVSWIARRDLFGGCVCLKRAESRYRELGGRSCADTLMGDPGAGCRRLSRHLSVEVDQSRPRPRKSPGSSTMEKSVAALFVLELCPVFMQLLSSEGSLLAPIRRRHPGVLEVALLTRIQGARGVEDVWSTGQSGEDQNTMHES